MRNFKEYVLWNAVTPQAVTSSTDATPIVVTKASHGYSTGDRVIINGHTTNVAANGLYKITVLSSSTFSLQDVLTGADIAGTGAGAGSSGVMALAPKIVFMEDFRDVILQVGTTGTATLTAKVAISQGDNNGEAPNWGAAAAPSNPYTYVQIINLATAVAVDGATGIAVTGTDIMNNYEVNANGSKYLTVIPTAWSAGAITIKALCFSGDS